MIMQSVKIFLAILMPSILSLSAYGMSSNKCDTDLIKENIINKLKSTTTYRTDITVNFDDLSMKSIIFGERPSRMNIQQVIETPESGLSHLAVFDGHYQWVESRRDNFIQVVKLNTSKLTNLNRPFDTGYYLMGTGLLNGEDYISTFTNLLNFYDLAATCHTNIINLSGTINKEKFRNYGLNTKTKKTNDQYINQYMKKFGHLSIEVDGDTMMVSGYKIGHNSTDPLFEASFSNTEFDVELDKNTFKYIPPKNVEVLDITSKIENN